MISVIIPAHNEEKVIRRSLDNICNGSEEGELEVIVACNGCKDDTAAIARAYGDPVRVVEVSEPGKWRGLNAGDAAATSFPRIYVDADIVVSLDAIRKLSEVLESGAALAAAPRMSVDLDGCPWSVRAFYRVWLLMPYSVSGMIGSGVYAVSAVGRARFDEFPAITADDSFVRLHFCKRERLTVNESTFVISPPRTLAGLVKIKTRAHFGELELRRYRPDLFVNENAQHTASLLALMRQPGSWPELFIYLYVRILSRILAWRKFWFGGTRWERDESSRDWAARSHHD